MTSKKSNKGISAKAPKTKAPADYDSASASRKNHPPGEEQMINKCMPSIAERVTKQQQPSENNSQSQASKGKNSFRDRLNGAIAHVEAKSEAIALAEAEDDLSDELEQLSEGNAHGGARDWNSAIASGTKTTKDPHKVAVQRLAIGLANRAVNPDPELDELGKALDSLTLSAAADPMWNGKDQSEIKPADGAVDFGLWTDRGCADLYWAKVLQLVNNFIDKTGRSDVVLWGEHRSGLILDKIKFELDPEKPGHKAYFLPDGQKSENPNAKGFSGHELITALSASVTGNSAATEYQDKKRVEGQKILKGRWPYTSKNPRYAKHAYAAPGFYPSVGTIADLLAHHEKGYPWSPAIRHPHDAREASTTLASYVLALDIDSGLPIDTALSLPLYNAYGSGIAQSASSTEKKPKYRVFFRTHPSEPLEGREQVENTIAFLMHVWRSQALSATDDANLSSADPACADANRIFYGAQGRAADDLRPADHLPKGFYDRQVVKYVEQCRELERVRLEQRPATQNFNGGSAERTYEMAFEAIQHLKPRQSGSGQYQAWVEAAKGLYNEFGRITVAELMENSPMCTDLAQHWDVSGILNWCDREKGSASVGIGVFFKLCAGETINKTQDGISIPMATAALIDPKRGPWLSDGKIHDQHKELTLKKSLADSESDVSAMEAANDELAAFEAKYERILHPERQIREMPSAKSSSSKGSFSEIPFVKDGKIGGAIVGENSAENIADASADDDEIDPFAMPEAIAPLGLEPNPDTADGKRPFNPSAIAECFEFTEVQTTLYDSITDIDEGLKCFLGSESKIAVGNQGRAAIKSKSLATSSPLSSVEIIAKIQKDTQASKSDWRRVLAVIGATEAYSEFSLYRIISEHYIVFISDEEKLEGKELKKELNQSNLTFMLDLVVWLNRKSLHHWITDDLHGRYFSEALKKSDQKIMKIANLKKEAIREAKNIYISKMDGLLCRVLADGTYESYSDGDSSGIDLLIHDEFGVDTRNLDKDLCGRILYKVAEMRGFYHPVEAYLKRCYDGDVAEGMTLDQARRITANVCRDHLHLDDALSNKYFAVALYNAVKTVFQAGCSMREVLGLVGGAHVGKTTFLEIMGEGFVSMPDAIPMSNTTQDRDTRMEIAGSWFIIFDEIDTMFGNRHDKARASALKKLASTKFQKYRAPYGSAVTEKKRSYNLFFTTNFRDLPFMISGGKAGENRYMIVDFPDDMSESGKYLDEDRLRAERDRIWGAFVMLYLSGEAYSLSIQDRRQQQDRAEGHQAIDLLTERVIAMCDRHRLYYRSFSLLDLAREMKDEYGDRLISGKKLGPVLRNLGFKDKRDTVIDGAGNLKRPSIWSHDKRNPEWFNRLDAKDFIESQVVALEKDPNSVNLKDIGYLLSSNELSKREATKELRTLADQLDKLDDDLAAVTTPYVAKKW